MWISRRLFLRVAELISAPPIGDSTEPVTVSSACSRCKVKGVSPWEPPWELHSQVPVKGAALDLLSVASAKLTAHSARVASKAAVNGRFINMLLRSWDG